MTNPNGRRWTRGSHSSAENKYLASIPAAVCPVEDCNRQPLDPGMRAPLCAHHIATLFEDYEEYRATSVERAIAAGAPRTPPPAPWEPPEKVRTSVVYYIQFAQHIKIGTTTSILDRLRTFSAHPDALLAVEPGNLQVESQRHAMFAVEREGRSELFKPSARLRDHIAHVRSTFGDPIEFCR